jgi:hypothetical protein
MTDDQQVRALLTRAADLPDTILPPAARLVETARRRRRLHTALSLLGVVAITAAGFTLPAALRGPGGVSVQNRSSAPPHPATAGELARGHWSVLPTSPLGRRSDPILAWTGNDLLELGGTRNGAIQRDGAAFDAAREQWRRIAPVPASVGLNGAVSVWTGFVSEQLFVTNGRTEWCRTVLTSACLPRAGLYSPDTNRWTTTALPKQLDGLQLAPPVWTGHEVVLAGTSGSATRPRLAVAAYRVADHRWQVITPRLPAGHPTGAVSMVATWHRVILWSLWSRNVPTKSGGTILSGVDVLVLRDGNWTTETGHWPQHRLVDGAAFANFRILIPPGQFWCGDCPGPFSESPARFADPTTLALTTIQNSPLVTQRFIQPPVWLWNGNTVLAANEAGGGDAAPDGRLGRLAAYDPRSRRWHVLPSAPGNPALAAPPVFAVQQLLVLQLNGTLLSLEKQPRRS